MVAIDAALKQKLKSDEYAHRSYTFIMYDADGAVELQFSNDKIVEQNVTFSESVCEGKTLVYGQCNAASISFKTALITEEMIGRELVVSYTVDDYDPIPMGSFIVASAIKDGNKIFHQVTAYDRMTLFDVDVSEWFNGLWSETVTEMSVKEFREALCAHVGVDCEDVTLVNDDCSVTQSITSGVLRGRDLLSATCEINGVFGKIDRLGVLRMVSLGSDVDETYTVPITITCKREDFVTQTIDRVVVREQANDIGGEYGAGENAYIVQGNFIAYGKAAVELDRIAGNIYSQIAGVTYTPYNGTFRGLPYMEAGDRIAVQLSDTLTVYSYIFSRSMSGVQGIRDALIANGTQETGEVFGVRNEILQLMGRSYSVEKSIDGVKSTVQTIETNLGITETQISALEQTVNGLSATITQSGGANLLRNSSAQFGDEYWDGPVQSATSIEIKAAYVAGTCFELQQGTIAQSIEVADGDYYVGFKYRKLLAAATITIEVNGVVTELDSSEYELVDLYNPLFVSGGVISVSITASDDGAGYIGDIMICKGGKQVWSPSPNETYSDNVQIGKGIQVDSNTVNTYTRIDADGNRIYNKATNAIVTEMTDKGILTEDITAQTATIDGFAFARVNGSLWIFDTQ